MNKKAFIKGYLEKRAAKWDQLLRTVVQSKDPKYPNRADSAFSDQDRSDLYKWLASSGKYSDDNTGPRGFTDTQRVADDMHGVVQMPLERSRRWHPSAAGNPQGTTWTRYPGYDLLAKMRNATHSDPNREAFDNAIKRSLGISREARNETRTYVSGPQSFAYTASRAPHFRLSNDIRDTIPGTSAFDTRTGVIAIEPKLKELANRNFFSRGAQRVLRGATRHELGHAVSIYNTSDEAASQAMDRILRAAKITDKGTYTRLVNNQGLLHEALGQYVAASGAGRGARNVRQLTGAAFSHSPSALAAPGIKSLPPALRSTLEHIATNYAQEREAARNAGRTLLRNHTWGASSSPKYWLPTEGSSPRTLASISRRMAQPSVRYLGKGFNALGAAGGLASEVEHAGRAGENLAKGNIRTGVGDLFSSLASGASAASSIGSLAPLAMPTLAKMNPYAQLAANVVDAGRTFDPVYRQQQLGEWKDSNKQSLPWKVLGNVGRGIMNPVSGAYHTVGQGTGLVGDWRQERAANQAASASIDRLRRSYAGASAESRAKVRPDIVRRYGLK